MQQMTIPDFGLVVLIGPSGAGKTTFARKHFRKSEILSSDLYRAVVGDDDRSSRTTRDAFDVMGYIARKRLEARRIAVIDATNLHREHRAVFANLARQQNAPLTAIVFELSENACQRQNGTRTDGEPRPHHVVRRHWQTLKRSMKTLPKEGFRRKFRIRSPEGGADAEIRLERMLQTTGEMMAGTAKRLQRDIRYSLAPPDKSAMKIGENKGDIHAERPPPTARRRPRGPHGRPLRQAVDPDPGDPRPPTDPHGPSNGRGTGVHHRRHGTHTETAEMVLDRPRPGTERHAEDRSTSARIQWVSRTAAPPDLMRSA